MCPFDIKVGFRLRRRVIFRRNFLAFYKTEFILQTMFTIVNRRDIFKMLFYGRIPPFDPGSNSAERDARHRFNLPDPVSKVRRVVNDERGAVLGEDVFKEPVKEQGCVHFPHRF